MKKLVICMVIVVIAALSGCATYQAYKQPGVTPEQIEKAKQTDCEAAKALIEESEKQVALLNDAGIFEGDAFKYWTGAKSGAKIAMALAGCF